MTAHRRESHGEKHLNIFRAVRRIADEFDDVAIIYPVHPSPAVREPAYASLGSHERIRLTEPLDVVELHNFYPHTYLILTFRRTAGRSSSSFGVPVLVLRDTTERPEEIKAGTLELAGTDEDEVYRRCRELLHEHDKYQSMSRKANPYGDGRASRADRAGDFASFWSGDRAPFRLCT